ncbi:MAG: Ig-like domain-containing protein, partial [Alphaproteobacteria bacterium]|nr:Ig-like domain-containing protein [Alphaproteobacteria bacterium]
MGPLRRAFAATAGSARFRRRHDGQSANHASNTVTATVTVANVNDAPVAAGSATLAAIDEDTANPAGTTVAALFGGNFSDIDGDTLAGVAISSYTTNSSRGDYQVSSDGSNWFGLSDATEALALTLRSTDFIRFVPAANYNGPVTALSAHLIDSGQTVAFRATVDLTGATGGATHVSSGLVALGGAINAVNDAPVLNANGGSLAYTENQAATAIDTALTVSDIDSANLTGATVAI